MHGPWLGCCVLHLSFFLAVSLLHLPLPVRLLLGGSPLLMGMALDAYEI
jgi:hypothetical protein